MFMNTSFISDHNIKSNMANFHQRMTNFMNCIRSLYNLIRVSVRYMRLSAENFPNCFLLRPLIEEYDRLLRDVPPPFEQIWALLERDLDNILREAKIETDVARNNPNYNGLQRGLMNIISGHMSLMEQGLLALRRSIPARAG